MISFGSNLGSRDALIAANRWFAGAMNKTLPAMVGKAGGFPRVSLEKPIEKREVA